jgi:hypothetical protein
MRLKRSLLLLIPCACSSGHLDAFTRNEPLGTGGASGGAISASGGTPQQGGNASGGQPISGSGGASVGPLLLDDFEDGDSQTLILGGWWYPKPDLGTPLISINTNALASRGNGTGTHALRVYGSGCIDWCFLGLKLPGKPSLDARSYSRLSFWARAEPSSVVRTLTLDMLDGTHVDAALNAVHFQKAIELTTDWKNFSIAFNELLPTSGSTSVMVDRSKLDTMELWVFTTPDPFDFLLDDVALLP